MSKRIINGILLMPTANPRTKMNEQGTDRIPVKGPDGKQKIDYRVQIVDTDTKYSKIFTLGLTPQQYENAIALSGKDVSTLSECFDYNGNEYHDLLELAAA